ncbi:ankyrin repeat-containing domain protein, partial [Hypomontagnella monticulosa]
MISLSFQTALLSRQFRMAQYLRTTGAPIDFRTTRLAQEIISSIYDMSKRPALEIELLRDLARDFEDIGISKYTGIHTAAKGLYDIKQQLEGDTESLDQPDENGNSALHWACHGGNVPVLRLLLDAGANVNAQNKSKQTPLMKAAHRGNVACVRALLEIPSCDPNKVDLQGRSALHHAAASPYAGGSEVMGLLLSHAANPFLRNNGGETVVHELASSYTSKLPAEELHSRLEALVGAGSKLDSVDGWNYTPALQAVAEDNSAALEALLHLGALVGGADCDKQNVFHLSALYGSLKTFQQLRDAHIRGIDIAGLNYQQDTPFELFEWRYGLQEGSLGIETSRKSTTREYETFRALLWESRNRNLETDIESCHRILKALQREDVVSAMQDLDELVDRYAAWVKEDEFEMYRNIRLEIEDGSFGLVARSLTEAIKFSTEAMDDCPIGDFRHDCSDVSSD